LIEAVCVDPQKLDLIWKNTRDFIKRAYECQPTDDTFEDVERRIHDGIALLWVAWDGEQIRGAAVTELWASSTGKVCAIVALGGRDWKDWRHCISAIEKFAKDEGCDRVRFSGRRAWLRLMPEYRQPWVTLEKKL
jgi:hypothetical protein